MIEASVHGVGSNPWMGSNKAVGRAGSIIQAILKQSAFINGTRLFATSFPAVPGLIKFPV